MKRELLASSLAAALIAAPIGLVSAADRTSNGTGHEPATVCEQVTPRANPVSVMGNREFGLGAPANVRKGVTIEGTNLSAEELRDQTIYDMENKKVGTVMAVTKPAGEDRKAIVDLGGIFGIDAKHVTVPVQRLGKKSDGRLVVTLTEDELEQMQEVREEDILAIDRSS